MKLFIVYAMAATLLSTSAIANERKRPPANVVTEQLVFEPIKVTIETVGTAEAKKSVNLYPAAADRVTKVAFKPGDYVEKGDVLLELDSRRQVAALKRAQIDLANKQRSFERLIKSKAKGAVTESQVDDAQALLDLALVSVAEAQADLDDRRVVAPFSGYLGLTEVEVGDRINQSTMITTIDDREQLFINFTVPESSYSLVESGTSISVQPWNNRDTRYIAALEHLDSRIDTQNRTLKVRALLGNSDDIFRPGLSFKVTLDAKGSVYPVIPEAALAWGATGSYIWLAEDGKARKKNVVIKQRLRGSILVEGDLAEGDILIVEGIQRLRENTPVSTANTLANR
ncbi:efflux RND transporter periplasmic adaptor subunit [Thalassotalea sp. PS06]|uniref:efflux RND transporter periplasmic adaptor subunit n=1 Tax=Thalassotalea sp. PS06 TaxID=2594005 RepID=UPI001164B5D9|nr:efflux RND transporter periplasmic adaptor subunit [Thalassotalea sp. PS06]QDP02209.1 efflux RND transporter periplasmic adaptor subunit [Thalassotalea sp. PS06]